MRFSRFLQLWEDASAEVARLQGDIAKTDATINQRTVTLKQRRELLIKQLAIAQKKAEQEANLKKDGEEKNQQRADQNGNNSDNKAGGSSIMGSGKTPGVL